MAIPPAFAHMLVDMDVPRDELMRLAPGMTPAKLAEVVAYLNAIEIAFANSKLRPRQRPAIRRTSPTPRMTRANGGRCSDRGRSRV